MGKPKRVSAAEQLRLRMGERGWNQTRLSVEIEASTSEVSRWLSGDRRPSLKFACRLADAVGLPVEAWHDDEAKSA